MFECIHCGRPPSTQLRVTLTHNGYECSECVPLKSPAQLAKQEDGWAQVYRHAAADTKKNR